MDNKKKFHGGLKVLLLLLFIMSLSMFSTCYASNQLDFVTVDFWTAVENHFLSLSTIDSNTKNFLNNANVTPINLQNTFELHKQDFIDYMTTNNLEDRNLLLLCCSSSSMLRLVFVPNNNTIGNSADFMIIAKDRNYLMIDTTVFNPTCYSITFYQGALSSSLRTLENCRQFSTGAGWSEYSGVTTNSIALSTDNNNFLIAPNLLGLNAQALNVVEYKNYYSDTSSSPKFLYYFIDFTTQTIPDEPSGEDSSGETYPGGTITNPSGEITGRVDLSNIENGIDNINNNLNNIENKIPTSGDMQSILSGETSKITGVLTDSADDLIDDTTISSGDITSALNFEIAEDPYSNFWLTLTNNLKTALLGSKRSIDISFQNRTWTISLDDYLVLPAWLSIILYPLSTCFFTFMIVRQWKHIFDKLSSGNVDSILQENSEERYF